MSDAVAQVVRVAFVVEPTEPLAGVAADPADDRVLEAALAFAAEVIVTGDRRLLALGEWRNIRILAPAQFLSDRP